MIPMDGGGRRTLLRLCFAMVVSRSLVALVLSLGYAPWLQSRMMAAPALGVAVPAAAVGLLETSRMVLDSWWLLIPVELAFLYGFYRFIDTLEDRVWVVPVALVAALLAVMHIVYQLMGVVAGELFLRMASG